MYRRYYSDDTAYIIPMYYHIICDILVWRANNLFEYTRACNRYIIHGETPLNIAASVYIAHLVCVYTYNNCYYLLVLLGTHYVHTRTRLVQFPKYERFSCCRVIGRRRRRPLRPRKDVYGVQYIIIIMKIIILFYRHRYYIILLYTMRYDNNNIIYLNGGGQPPAHRNRRFSTMPEGVGGTGARVMRL